MMFFSKTFRYLTPKVPGRNFQSATSSVWSVLSRTGRAWLPVWLQDCCPWVLALNLSCLNKQMVVITETHSMAWRSNEDISVKWLAYPKHSRKVNFVVKKIILACLFIIIFFFLNPLCACRDFKVIPSRWPARRGGEAIQLLFLCYFSLNSRVITQGDIQYVH